MKLYELNEEILKKKARMKFKTTSKILMNNKKNPSISTSVYENNNATQLDYEEKEQQLLAKDEQIQVSHELLKFTFFQSVSKSLVRLRY
jgi:hypothetical protein